MKKNRTAWSWATTIVFAGTIGLIGIGGFGEWAGPAIAGEQPEPSEPVDARLQFLKSLQGEWIAVGDTDEMFHNGTFVFSVSGGGGTVEERSLPGTPMEMLTVYHMDGKELVGTHYCALNNQPHVKAAAKVEKDSLAFSCDGRVANTKSHDEQHVHDWTIRRDADGTLFYTAHLFADGKLMDAPAVRLARK